MTYKQFVKFSNDRCYDGLWSFEIAATFAQIVREIETFPWWRREKEFRNRYLSTVEEIMNELRKVYNYDE